MYRGSALPKNETRTPEILGNPLWPSEGAFFRFLKFFVVVIFEISETLDMSSKQLGEMFEGDSADTCG